MYPYGQTPSMVLVSRLVERSSSFYLHVIQSGERKSLAPASSNTTMLEHINLARCDNLSPQAACKYYSVAGYHRYTPSLPARVGDAGWSCRLTQESLYLIHWQGPYSGVSRGWIYNGAKDGIETYWEHQHGATR